MNAPDVDSIRANGWKLSSNATPAQIARCAEEAWACYVSHFITPPEAAAVADTTSVAKLWNALTFLRFVQDYTFGTRTGGENKRMDYGIPPTELTHIKESVADLLRQTEADYGKDSDFIDVFKVFFKSQFFN